MIVWLASYPRSGNTFFRILLRQLYGASTYTGFMSGDDLELDVKSGDLTGNAPLPRPLRFARFSKDPGAVLREYEASDEIYFIKTHNRFDELYDTESRCILFVRDPRDTFVSTARYMMNVDMTWKRLARKIQAVPERYPSAWTALRGLLPQVAQTAHASSYKALGMEEKLFQKLLRTRLVHSPRWSKLNVGWMERPRGATTVVRFEDLLADPGVCVERALAAIDVPLKLQSGGRVPTFAELKAVHPQFFRQGTAGGWKTEFPAELNEPLGRVHGAAMQRFGYAA